MASLSADSLKDQFLALFKPILVRQSRFQNRSLSRAGDGFSYRFVTSYGYFYYLLANHDYDLPIYLTQNATSASKNQRNHQNMPITFPRSLEIIEKLEKLSAHQCTNLP